MKKIKFKDLTGSGESIFLSDNKVSLKAEDLAVILGGDGCTSGICVNKRTYGSEQFCQGCGTCTSGIGVCQENTGPTMVPVDDDPAVPAKPLINFSGNFDSTITS
jgi:hypothetical protein